jgi:mediator of RNA polymerase II transcription subunit 7
MADQQLEPIKAPFPAPPPFYQHFTKENLNQLRRLRKEAQQSSASNDASLDILKLPPELRYLIPPTPPSNDTTYRTFADHITRSAPDQTLADAGIEQLFPSHPSTYTNPAPHLIALARSLLTSFLQLVSVLSANPTLFESKIADLEVIMVNMHELVNQYRPHQARESLVLMMEERVAGMREEVRMIREGRGKVDELLRGLSEVGDSKGQKRDEEGEGEKEEGKDKWKEGQQDLWKEMDAVMDGGS